MMSRGEALTNIKQIVLFFFVCRKETPLLETQEPQRKMLRNYWPTLVKEKAETSK